MANAGPLHVGLQVLQREVGFYPLATLRCLQVCFGTMVISGQL